MRCIFCENESSTSRSVEHIIPQSLGNDDHVLSRGVVCDGCNNYFARKIEEPLLSSVHFRNLRSRQGLESKRGIIPPEYGIFPQARIPIGIRPSTTEGPSVFAWHEKDEKIFAETLQRLDRGTFHMPHAMPIKNRILERFIAKIGFEIYISRALEAGQNHNQIIGTLELKAIRRFIRHGDKPLSWPISRRKIYDENKRFEDGKDNFQVVHEFSLFVTEENEIYAVIAIFGEEFSINLGGPTIDGYERWLSENQNRSPLYLD
jgi:HNH endonuclease